LYAASGPSESSVDWKATSSRSSEGKLARYPQQREPLLAAPDRAMALEQALRDEREIPGVLLLDALPGLDRAGVITRGRRGVRPG